MKKTAKQILSEFMAQCQNGSFEKDFVNMIWLIVNDDALMNENQETFIYSELSSIFNRGLEHSPASRDFRKNYAMVLPLATFINSCR